MKNTQKRRVLKLRNLTNKSSGSSSSSHVNLKSFMSPFFIHSRVVLNFLKILDDMKDPFAYDSYDDDLEKQHKTLAWMTEAMIDRLFGISFRLKNKKESRRATDHDWKLELRLFSRSWSWMRKGLAYIFFRSPLGNKGGRTTTSTATTN